ncbi:hypothetical protein JZ751_014471, partial [Albula glossodonta]
MSAPFPARIQSRMEQAKTMKEEDKLYRHDGVLYPVIMCPPENLAALENLEARPDDVMLVAYPKCATQNPVRLFVSHRTLCVCLYLTATQNPVRLFVSHRTLTLCVCLYLTATQNPVRLFVSHRTLTLCVCLYLTATQNPVRFNWMVAVLRKIITAGSGREQDAKMPPLIEFFGPEMVQMLVIFRNPKDTAVSFYHFSVKNPVLPTPESWDKFYAEYMSGDVPWGLYFDHALAWEKRLDDPNVMVITYEELKEDLFKGVQQISSFEACLPDMLYSGSTQSSRLMASKRGSLKTFHAARRSICAHRRSRVTSARGEVSTAWADAWARGGVLSPRFDEWHPQNPLLTHLSEREGEHTSCRMTAS